jgi:hypothetical protein
MWVRQMTWGLLDAPSFKLAMYYDGNEKSSNRGVAPILKADNVGQVMEIFRAKSRRFLAPLAYLCEYLAEIKATASMGCTTTNKMYKVASDMKLYECLSNDFLTEFGSGNRIFNFKLECLFDSLIMQHRVLPPKNKVTFLE